MRIPRPPSNALLAGLIAMTMVAGVGVSVVRDGDEQPLADASSRPSARPDTGVPGDDAASGRDEVVPPPPAGRFLHDDVVFPPLPVVDPPGGPKPLTSSGMQDEFPAAGLVPSDYIGMRRLLSKAVFSEIATVPIRVPMADGVEIYVEVTRPDPATHGDGPWPVVMEISPYHGTIADRKGTRIFPDPRDENGTLLGLTGYFAPRGYAVVMVDLRGTGRSQGCLDHLGPNDASDIKEVVEWAAEQPWSNGRVGITGHSYVGSTPSLAAAMKPKGLVTIAPSAGLATMYDHQFQFGVPYSLQWLGPIEAYEQLALQRHLPSFLGAGNGDNFGNDMQDFGCGLPSSAITAGHGQYTGQYQGWHAERDWREAAAEADIPIFIIHGVNDDAARIPAAEWFFGMRTPRATDKVWLGQWTHGSNGHVNTRFDQWQYALHAWFDKHLKQMDVDTGPPVEVFLNDQTVWAAPSWDATRNDTVAVYADARDETLTFDPPDGPGEKQFPLAVGLGRQIFLSDPLEEDLFVAGLPEMTLHASLTTSQVTHIIATWFATDDRGFNGRPISYCAIQPQLRNGADTPSPIVPGEEMILRPQCFTVAHRALEGQRLQLIVGMDSSHHVPFAPPDALLTIYTGPNKTRISLPLITGASLHEDLRLQLAS